MLKNYNKEPRQSSISKYSGYYIRVSRGKWLLTTTAGCTTHAQRLFLRKVFPAHRRWRQGRVGEHCIRRLEAVFRGVVRYYAPFVRTGCAGCSKVESGVSF